ncbi:MAG: hypothetical protein QM753_02080 [Thermomicrobiales bacterium]
MTQTSAQTTPLRPWRRRALQTTLALAVGSSSLFGTAIMAGAQDGSGGATPPPASPISAATCSIPDLSAAQPKVQPTGTPTTAPTQTATSTPTKTAPASPAGTPDASPIASATATTETPAASPVAETPDTLASELTMSANAVADCLTKGDFTTLASITGDTFRGQLIGAGEPVSAEDFTDLAPSLAVIPYTIAQVDDATGSGTTATATVTYLFGNQVRIGKWSFTKASVDGKDVWVLDEETPQAVTKPGSAEEATVTIKDNAYAFDPQTINGNEVFFSISNKDKVNHELFVVKLASDTKIDVLLTTPGPGLPQGVTFVGQVTVPAGSDSELLLTDLEPGTYQVVDLLPNDQGLPHLSDGMKATFTVK